VNEIRHALGDLVFGERDDELEHVVLRQLSQNKLSLASLEIGAASWIGDWMLKAGHLGVESYVGSLAFPDLQAALRWLDRDSKERLSMSSSDAKNSSLSDAVWCKLAEETRTRFQSDIALVVGIYPTIEQMEIGKSSFEFTFAIATAENVTLVHRTLGGHPDVLGPRVAKTGLDLLRLQLCTILQPLPSEVRSTAGTWESHGDSPG
jgi:nicotinamide-nucleotide amidase